MNKPVQIAKGVYRISHNRYQVNMAEVDEIPVKLYEIPELAKHFTNPITEESRGFGIEFIPKPGELKTGMEAWYFKGNFGS